MTKLHQSDCPIARALDVVGDRWTLLLIRDMSRGVRTYQGLLTAKEGIPTNILAARLKRLVKTGLVEKRAYQEKPPRFEYALTARGRGLLPALEALEDWGAAELGGLRAEAAPAPPAKPAPRNEWAFGPDDSVW